MAKKKMLIQKGAITNGKRGGKKSVEYLEDALKELAHCCGQDCCNHVIRMSDKGTGVKTVGYFFNGAWVVETDDAFKAKVKAGTFAY